MNRLQLIAAIKEKQSYLCVGLDTDITKIPQYLQTNPNAVLAFNKAIIDATKNYCVAYKINTAFYEAMGVKGWQIIEETCNYIPTTHFKIADAKRGDIGNTSAQYAKTFFETFAFDAVTVAPYMGEDSVRPFLEYQNKFTIVLGLTSNAGSNDFQKLIIHSTKKEKKLYQIILEKIANWGNANNLMFVVGATQANDLQDIRSIIPNNFLLIPGVGAQGGSLAEVSKYGLNKDCGLLINASRNIIYASNNNNFSEAALQVAKNYNVDMKEHLKTIWH
ncbi:MAG: orotidine-5'-phosphate decarboxylase [Bacteroidetes bacterium]|nr:orotidine-5'-phosphate decarboxylase [Bacteroidota bacterium]MBS1590769.1 orotidine-5'-phosphate decarboxylase [Bacteroidota bacterium]